jgi:voltage-gated potassium channel
MGFLRQASAAAVLVALSLSLECGGMAALIQWGIGHFARDTYRLGPLSRSHRAIHNCDDRPASVADPAMAAFYRWNCFPSWESAFYFSTTSYSTVGYGDLVLPRMWRNLGPAESLTGVLMCALSASFLFAIVTRLVGREGQFSPPLRNLLEVSASLREQSRPR